MSKVEKFKELRKQGLTCREIADMYGCSPQYVSQSCADDIGAKSFRIYKEDECAYPGLRSWLNENKISRAGLTRMLLGKNSWGGSRESLRNKLKGRSSFQISDINILIDRSGLTYEQLFRQ